MGKPWSNPGPRGWCLGPGMVRLEEGENELTVLSDGWPLGLVKEKEGRKMEPCVNLSDWVNAEHDPNPSKDRVPRHCIVNVYMF